MTSAGRTASPLPSPLATRSSLASLASRRSSRRNFLSWLGAASAATAVGCATSTSEEDEVLAGRSYEGEDLGSDESEQTVCRATTRDAQGPYFERGSPYRVQLAAPEEAGVRLFVEGRLVGPDCRTPLKDYGLDLWQADAEGNYYRAGTTNYRLRGKVRTDAQGRYKFETILPGRYGDAAGIRPAHIHVSFLSPGGNVILTSQLYFAGDPYLGKADYCTRAGACNSADPARALELKDTVVNRVAGKSAWFEGILPRT